MTTPQLTKLSADTIHALRGLKAAAEEFRKNPNESSDRLDAWLYEAAVIENAWKALFKEPKQGN